HHLHGFGDLARVLHALDLGSNFLDSGHRSILKGRQCRLGCAVAALTCRRLKTGLHASFPGIQKAPCFLNSWMAAARAASSSFDSSLVSSMRLTMSSCLALR